MTEFNLGVAKRGDVVFIECDKSQAPKLDKIRQELATQLRRTGIKGVVLPPGLRLARNDETPAESVPAGRQHRIGFIQ